MSIKFIKNFDWSPKSLLKLAGMLIVGVIILSIVIALFSFAIKTVFTERSGLDGYYVEQSLSMPATTDMGMERGVGFASKVSISSDEFRRHEPTNQPTHSLDGDFEIKEFNATVVTASLNSTCDKIETLRNIDGVIFENANRSDRNCFYSFKVEKKDEAEAVTLIESLDPKDFNERVYTIKNVIENYDTELSILESRLESVEQMLKEAEEQYGEFQRLATAEGDVESLASIFDSRLKYVNQFNSERSRIIEQIQRYNKNKSDQLERLLYSTFTIHVYEDKIIDFERIGDSWKYELERFVNNTNEVFQGITLNLGIFLMRAFEVALYFFVGLFILKFAWIGAKRVWRDSFKVKTSSSKVINKKDSD